MRMYKQMYKCTRDAQTEKGEGGRIGVQRCDSETRGPTFRQSRPHFEVGVWCCRLPWQGNAKRRAEGSGCGSSGRGRGGTGGEVAIEIPEAPAEGGGEEDPGEVGFEEVRGDGVDGVEGGDGGDEYDVQGDDVVEGGAQALGAEEERLPGEVEHELHGVEREWQGLLGEAALRPHQPRRQPHERVQ